MIQRLRRLILKNQEVLLYLVFGCLTTLVNYIVYFPLYQCLQFSAAVSNGIAWMVAVIFAYITNKPFVFKSRDWSKDTVIAELTKFVGGRIFSGLTETGLLVITVDLLCFNGVIMKLITSVLVIVINYVVSKCLVFRASRH